MIARRIHWCAFTGPIGGSIEGDTLCGGDIVSSFHFRKIFEFRCENWDWGVLGFKEYTNFLLEF